MELSKSFADHKVKVRLKCTILIKGGLLIKWLLNLKALGMVWVIERINFVSTTNPNIRLSNLILTRFSMYQEVVIAPYSASKEKQSWLGSMRDFLMQASTSSVMCETSCQCINVSFACINRRMGVSRMQMVAGENSALHKSFPKFMNVWKKVS